MKAAAGLVSCVEDGFTFTCSSLFFSVCSSVLFSSGFLAVLATGVGEYGINLLLPKVSLKNPKPYLSRISASKYFPLQATFNESLFPTFFFANEKWKQQNPFQCCHKILLLIAIAGLISLLMRHKAVLLSLQLKRLSFKFTEMRLRKFSKDFYSNLQVFIFKSKVVSSERTKKKVWSNFWEL